MALAVSGDMIEGSVGEKKDESPTWAAVPITTRERVKESHVIRNAAHTPTAAATDQIFVVQRTATAFVSERQPKKS